MAVAGNRTGGAGRRGRRQRWGFTIIEMMVVVGIIVLLIAISIPVIGRAREGAKDAATKQLMGTLTIGLEQYAVEQGGWYPPDQMYIPTYGNPTQIWQLGNAEALAQGLTGYLSGDYDGAGSFTNAALTDDTSEFGFRITGNGRGKVYGPYAPIDAKSYRDSTSTVSSLATGVTTYAYVDTRTAKDIVNHKILYFRAVPMIKDGVGRPVTSVFAPTPNDPVSGKPVSYPELLDATTFNLFTGVFAVNTTLLPTGSADPTSASMPDFFAKLGTTSNGAIGAVSAKDSYLLISSGGDAQYFTKDDIVQVRQ